MTYSMVELIGQKRDGGTLSADQLAWIIAEYTGHRIADYQMSAFLMAILFNGFDTTELAAWTNAMLHSGEVLDLSAVAKPKVDKHSTGGVGDKVSIPLAPIVAACGVAVPMISGRSLAHTGGTLDKLESIPGFTTDIAPWAFPEQLNDIGVVMAGQTETLVPADRHLYALRDATGTVPSLPLIASSIMSKKVAEDIDALLLDVKVGSGAFMKNRQDAAMLAQTMVEIGRSSDTPVTVVLTDMSQPLGREVGNANEIIESISVLRGEGPEDVTELTLTFASEMITLAGIADSETARGLAEQAVSSGAALDVLARLIERQGGDPRVIENTAQLPSARNEYVITAPRDGWITRCDALDIGFASVRLGAGRSRKKDVIDPSVGFSIEAKVGDSVSVGDPLARIAWNDQSALDSALSVLGNAWRIADEPTPKPDLIMGVIT